MALDNHCTILQLLCVIYFLYSNNAESIQIFIGYSIPITHASQVSHSVKIMTNFVKSNTKRGKIMSVQYGICSSISASNQSNILGT